MAKVSTYLNFPRETELAFNFYREVFGTEFTGPIVRFGDMPGDEGGPVLPEGDKNLVLNVQLPITGGHLLMDSDVPASLDLSAEPGEAAHVMLHVDSAAEADRLFAALSEGGAVGMPMEDMFWGSYYGACTDSFGVSRMISFEKTETTQL